MTERRPTPEGAILVAIDVAKHRNEVLIETPGHRRRRRITVPSTREEHDRLVALLTGLDGPVVAGFEGEAQPNGTATARWRIGCSRPGSSCA